MGKKDGGGVFFSVSVDERVLRRSFGPISFSPSCHWGTELRAERKSHRGGSFVVDFRGEFSWWIFCGGFFVVDFLWWIFVVDFLWWIFVVDFLWWIFCGGFLWWIFCGGFLWWIFCGGFLWWIFCGGFFVVDFCGGFFVVDFCGGFFVVDFCGGFFVVDFWERGWVFTLTCLSCHCSRHTCKYRDTHNCFITAEKSDDVAHGFVLGVIACKAGKGREWHAAIRELSMNNTGNYLAGFEQGNSSGKKLATLCIGRWTMSILCIIMYWYMDQYYVLVHGPVLCIGAWTSILYWYMDTFKRGWRRKKNTWLRVCSVFL